MPIHTARNERIFEITIDRPEARNSLDLAHFGALARAWESFRDDDDLWVAIVTGVDDVFCVGADLKTFVPAITEAVDEMAAKRAAGADELEVPATAAMTAVLREFPLYKPVIAAVNGICAAGGMEMLLGTDLRIAAEEATFRVTEARRGLFPGGGTTVRLPRQIPFARAMEVLLMCDPMPAAEAAEYGIVNKVVARDEVMDTARAYAEVVMKNAPLAIRHTKESVLTGLRLPLEEAFEQELMHAAAVFGTADAREGPKAFAEKREPRWQGR